MKKIYCPIIRTNDDEVLQIIRPGVINSDKCKFARGSLLNPQTQVFSHLFRKKIRDGKKRFSFPETDLELIGAHFEEYIPSEILDDIDVVILHGSGPQKTFKYIAKQCKQFYPHAPIINVDYADVPIDRMRSELNNIDQNNVYNFKRSMVDTKSKKINKFPYHIQHTAFCVREDVHEQQNSMYRPYNKRKYNAACFFPGKLELEAVRPMMIGERGTPRSVRGWLASVVKCCCPNSYIGYTSGDSTTSPQREGRAGVGISTPGTTQYKYCDISTNSKIIVTACPPNYEGDYRLMEAMTSGALVMHNKMLLPPSGLLDGVHWVVYNDAVDLQSKIEYYTDHQNEAEKIANAGRNFVLDNHRPHHRVEQWLKVVGVL